MTTNIAIFKGKEIRKTIYNNEWWFSVADIVAILTNSVQPEGYIKDMRRRDSELAKGWGQIATPLLIPTAGGQQKINCANIKGLFRIIQSISSPKAEPLKRWLAKVGYERVQEIENPELATRRTKMLYKLKGYPEDWIEKRMRGIAIREELTDEWQKRGIQEQKDYEILTAEILQATFGIKPNEYKKLKGLKRENLRDHMDDMELILTMLGEATTTKFTKERNSVGFNPLQNDARDGGSVAGRTRKDIEKQSGKKIVSSNNYLSLPKSEKLLRKE
ncbi:Bro-N domain-containing protein [Patescibacteria group bacterium]|nr:Bro-N domain-containing protein [Patescibacteria group bacterium]MBU0879288.1 Bro-N domain-containing protein [Patescibacteria group bacterium]MBU0880452.1 Bro-N domain-containing protein [Patescibacteria group bacterium]MBU0898086.1 Bro-N domain-containing protein [Patescibacteria group bacterium]MBU1783239.1 Bro-N domain-containing protein [Patescibacteria group bacterium]